MRPVARVSSYAVVFILLTAIACYDAFGPAADLQSAIASISVQPAQASVSMGKTVAFSAVALDASGHPVTDGQLTWSSEDTSIATVSPSGEVSTRHAGSTRIIARSGAAQGGAALTIVPESGASVASVKVSPASGTINVGETEPLTATLTDSAGNVLAGRTTVWSSSDTTIATVNDSGVVTGAGAGNATITASSGGKVGTSTVTVVAVPMSHNGFFVSPSGSANGDGSVTRPWNLATALAGPSKVQAGDTLWLRGGLYPSTNITSTLSGTASAPIIVRQYPGERATIDGNLIINGTNTWYWGFEVTNSNTGTADVMGIYDSCPGCRFINLIVHDHSGNGFGVWGPAIGAQVYGSIVYNNGFHGSTSTSYGHGIYSQNSTGTKEFRDNIIFNQFGYGFHIYAEGGSLSGFDLEGNVSFDNGINGPQHIRPDIFVGGMPAVASRITVDSNMTYLLPNFQTDGPYKTTELGYGLGNQDIKVTDNYFAGGGPPLLLNDWVSAVVTGNTIYNGGYNGTSNPQGRTPTEPWLVNVEGKFGSLTWSNNHWYGQDPAGAYWLINSTPYTWATWKSMTGVGGSDVVSATRPSGVNIFVRPNKYERGRANIIVYNWDGAGSAAVNLTGVLQTGDHFAVYNAQNYFGTPVASGTYDGGPVTIPLAAVAPPTPIGGFVQTVPSTGTEFNVFVVLLQP